MNKRPRLFLIGGVILLLALLFSACTPDVPTPPPSELTEGGLPEEQTAGETSEVGTGGEETGSGDSEAAATGLAALPEDIPVPRGAYDENISNDGIQINYKIAGTAEAVVAYFQENLPSAGWEFAGPQDTAVGNTALMLRSKPNGDRISINLQYNPAGEFTVVTMVVTRAK